MESHLPYLTDEEESYFPQDFQELCANFEDALTTAEDLWPHYRHRGWEFESRLANFAHEWPAINDALRDDRTMPRVLELYESLFAGSQTRIKNKDDQETLRNQVGQFIYRQHDRMYELACSENETVARPATRLLFLGSYKLLGQQESAELMTLVAGIHKELLAADQPDALLTEGVIEGLSRALFWSGDDQSGQLTQNVLQAVDTFAADPKTAHITETIRRSSLTRFLSNVDAPVDQEKIDNYLAHPGYLATVILVERFFRTVDFATNSDAELATWCDKLALFHQRTQTDGTETAFLDYLYKEARRARTGSDLAQRRIGAIILAHAPLDAEVLRAGWEHASGDGKSTHYKPEVYQCMNLERIAQIEEAEPGATSYLMREHNIRNFTRLPTHIWVNQYRNRDDQTRAKEVVLVARADHSVSFTYGTFRRSVQELYQHAQQNGTDVVVFECDTPSDTVRSLFKIRHHYNQRISGLYAAAHGNDFGMYFGDSPKSMLSVPQIQRYDAAHPAIARLRSLFLAEAEGAFSSCSTGLPGGPAEFIAKRLGVAITAPDADSNMRRLNPGATGNGTAFQPQYNGAQPMRHTA